MKLIFAGISSAYSLNPQKFLYNCTRNAACQKMYFVPLRTIRDLYFYVDFPDKPDFINAVAIDACCYQPLPASPGDFSDDFNEDFDIGDTGGAGTCSHPVVFDKYVVGQKPDNTWYGVFQTSEDFRDFKQFYFRFNFTVNGEDYIYYSEEFELDDCAPLTCLRGCYPNEPVGADAWDCNGIYYGLHSGPEEPLGDPGLRYFHTACVRYGSVIDTTAKLTLSLFNTKRTYKAILQRENTLEFELVPSFYKDVLLGIFTRGTVEINGTNYVLQTEQNWKVLDFNSKLWQLDTLLFTECKNYFGCKPANCELPVLPCINNLSQGTWEVNEDTFTQNFVGTMNSTDAIEWEMLDLNRTVLASGSVEDDSMQFVDTSGLNPNTDCYFLRWRIKCRIGYSDWKENKFGNCEIPATPIEGRFSILSFGGGVSQPAQNCISAGTTKLRFRFDTPLTEALTLEFAGYWHATGGSGVDPSAYISFGGSIIPVTNADKSKFASPNAEAQAPLVVNLPIGTTDFTTDEWKVPLVINPSVFIAFESYPVCNSFWGPISRNKFYFRVTSPLNRLINFEVVYDTPAPNNTLPGGIEGITQLV